LAAATCSKIFHFELQSDLIRMVDDPMSRRAYEQLMNLETELRDSGIVYKCLPSQHDPCRAPAPNRSSRWV
jgi:hypothetical protein